MSVNYGEDLFPFMSAEQHDLEVPVTDENKTKEQLIAELVELRSRERKYRQIFQNMTTGCALHEIICDDRGKPINYRYLELNPAFEKLTGVPSSALLGKTILDVLPNTEEYWIETFGKVALTGEPVSYENYSRELGKFYDTWVFSPQKNQFAVIFSDISERKRIEEALREAQEKYRNIIENAVEGIFQTTIEGKVLMVNPAYANIFGYDSPQEMMNAVKDIRQVYFDPEQRSEAIRLLKEKGVLKGFEGKAYRKDGEIFWFSSNARTVLDAQGHPLYLEGSLEDISQRKDMEGKILQAQKLESLGILAGGIAHDFNNILTAILGNISLAKSLDESKEQLIKRLTEAEKASLRASELAQQLLTFSKGGAPIKRVVSIQRIIEHSVQFALTGSNVQSELFFQEGLWPAEVDEGQISQVIQNLIINAQQAMPSGGRIRIEAKNLSIEENAGQNMGLRKGDYLLILIQDQGSGISKDHLSKIFDPYFTTKQKGTGLGLSISYSIIQRHQGYITAESNPGGGTTFFIYLPASPGAHISPEKSQGEALTRGKGRVLVMDDEESVLNLAGEVLKNLGYEVELVKNGIEAVEIYKRARATGRSFALVITDLTVPGDIGGVETLRRLKEIDPHVDVIVSSGYSNDPAMANFKAFGFSGCLKKPYRVFEVSETLREVLKARRLDD